MLERRVAAFEKTTEVAMDPAAGLGPSLDKNDIISNWCNVSEETY